MQLILRGNILTPLVTKQTEFHFEGCKAIITSPRRRYYTKINAGKPMYPYSFMCYLGQLEVQYSCSTQAQAKRKLSKLLEIGSIGRFHTEGLGRIKWTGAEIRDNPIKQRRRKYSNIRIRKGLPHNLPQRIQDLLRYALLHDFVHTEKHMSKIYTEPYLEDANYLKQHHDNTKDPFIRLFQKYDRLAAILTRRIRSPRDNRYNWTSNGTIDFERLSKEIEEVSKKSIWKLYEYIYDSIELSQLNESLDYGHTSLKRHLLVIANLIVRDFQKQKL